MKNNVESIYSLSPMQQGMLYHKLLDDKSTVYFVRYLIKFTGVLDVEKVRESLNLLSEKYDILRTSFIIPKKDDKPWQVVLRKKELELKVIDIRGISSKEDEIEKIKEEDLKRGFDLQKDSLLRLTIIKISEEESVGLWSLHHIILDGWCSSAVLINFMNNYSMLVNNKDIFEIRKDIDDYKENVPAYEEYIKWINNKDEKEALDHWNKLLEGYSDVTEIQPLGLKVNTSEEMGRSSIRTDKDFTEKLKKLTISKNITVNTVLESCLGVLLQRYNRNNDIVFGKVVSGRNADITGIDKVVGLFINTIPVRVSSDNNTTYDQLLKKMYTQALEASNYEYCSLSNIQSESESELIKVLFVYENYFVDEDAIAVGAKELEGKLKMEIEDGREQTNYPITVSTSMDDVLNLDILYDAKLFTEEEIQIILKRYYEVLKRAVEYPDEKINEFDFLIEGEKDAILNKFNNAELKYDENLTVVKLLERTVNKYPEKIAVEFKGKKITYKELNKRSNQLAVKLRELGVKKNDYVAIMAEKSVEMIIAICGIVKAGGAYVPIDSQYPLERINYMMEDCNPKVLLLYDVQYESNVPSIDLSKVWEWTEEKNNIEDITDANDLIYLIYTSGTTGKPKGVMISQKGVIRLVYKTDYLDMNEKTTILQTGTLSFDAATFEIWGVLLNGGELHLADTNLIMDSECLRKMIEDNSVNTMWLTVSLFNQLVNIDFSVFDSLKYLLIGGEKLSETHVKKLLDNNKNITLINGYGPTENTTFTTCFHIINKQKLHKIPIGKPIRNTQVYILNGSKLCGIGMAGELCITGDGVAEGYLNRPELTSEKFSNSPFNNGKMYRSGDLVRWLPNGNIDFIGRIDNQIKLRGFRIELTEIECALKKIEDVCEAAVILKNQGEEKCICAYVVQKNSDDTNHIREILKNELPYYMVPSYIMNINEIPLTMNGKLNKKALPEIKIELNKEYIEPRNDQEKEIVKVFEEILNIGKVGLNDDFYEIGGDSIKCIKIVSRLKQLNYNLKIRDIMEMRVIDKIMNKIEGLERPDSITEKAQNNSSYNLDVKTMVILESSHLEDEDFKHSIVYKELLNYDLNKEKAGVLERFSPFAYQRFFLVNQRANICAGKTEIIGDISKEDIIEILRSIIKEQSAFRLSYDQENNMFNQFNYVDDWNIPYVDLSKSENISEDLIQFRAIFNMSSCFDEDKLLLKVILVKTQEDKHVVYFYSQHSIWDYFSIESLTNIVNDKFICKKKYGYVDLYNAYIKSRGSRENCLTENAKEFFNEFLVKYKNYMDLMDNKKPQYFIEISKKLKQDQLEDILENPIDWIVKLFALINMKQVKNDLEILFPIIQIQNGRKSEDELKTIGLYLDIIPKTFELNSGRVVSSENSKDSFVLFNYEDFNEGLQEDYFDPILMVNFVTIIDDLYVSDYINECKIDIGPMPDLKGIRGFISMTLINDMIKLAVPSIGNDLDRLSKVIREYLD